MDRQNYPPGAIIPGTVYRVVRVIGAGGMGTVYDVEDTTVGKRYVLKALHAELSSRRDLAKRMEAEARTLARLTHPNIVEVVTAGATADDLRLPYYVMEKLNGQNLRTILSKKGSLDLPHALHIEIDLLDALDNAHDKGVIHRDVKPDNIFLHRSLNGVTVTKLLDFGIMRLLDSGPGVTAGRFMGTLRYAAAEQLRGEALSPQTDLYAAGLVLYEMIAGCGPFDDLVDPNKIAAAHIQREPPPLSRWGLYVPDSLEKLLRGALAKDPSKRPKDAFTFAAQLRNLKRTLQAERTSESETSRPTEVPVAAIVAAAGGSESELSRPSFWPLAPSPSAPPGSPVAYATTEDEKTRAMTPSALKEAVTLEAVVSVALSHTKAVVELPSTTGGTLLNASVAGAAWAGGAAGVREEARSSGVGPFDRDAPTRSAPPEAERPRRSEGTPSVALVPAGAARTEPWPPQRTLRMDVREQEEAAGAGGGERVSDLLGLLPTRESIVAPSDGAASRTIVPSKSSRRRALSVLLGFVALGAVVTTLALGFVGARRQASPGGEAKVAASTGEVESRATAPFAAPTLAPPLDTDTPSPPASAPEVSRGSAPADSSLAEPPPTASREDAPAPAEPQGRLGSRADSSWEPLPLAPPPSDLAEPQARANSASPSPPRPARKRKLPGSGL